MARLRLRWQAGLALGFAASVLVLLWSRTTLGGAGDVVIAFPTPFSSLDGSGQDFDNAANGVFTVQGDLTITNGGSISCNDDLPLPPNSDACPIWLQVAGNLTIERGGSITAENRRSGGDGGNIFLNVGGDLLLQATGGGLPGGIISTSKLSAGGDPGVGGDATIHVGGDVTLRAGAQILADARGEAGAIEIAGRHVRMEGLASASSKVFRGRGGPIKIVASANLELTAGSVVASRGIGRGADLVHLEGCVVSIEGKVESADDAQQEVADGNFCNDTSRPDHPDKAMACVEVIARAINVGEQGEVSADTGQHGIPGRGWIDLAAFGDITVLGSSTRAFAVHANDTGAAGGEGGYVTAKSAFGNIRASGNAFQADATSVGGNGGRIVLDSATALIDGSVLSARGSFFAIGRLGHGGFISVQTHLESLEWAGGVGDVRPTGDGVLRRGEISLTGCGGVTTLGTIFPFMGTSATSPTIVSGPCDCRFPVDGPFTGVCVQLPFVPGAGDVFYRCVPTCTYPVRTCTPNIIQFGHEPRITPTPGTAPGDGIRRSTAHQKSLIEVRR